MAEDLPEFFDYCVSTSLLSHPIIIKIGYKHNGGMEL